MSDKIQITCPHCAQVFSADLPVCEIMNTEHNSVIIASHPSPVVCLNNRCGQKFRLAIVEVGTGWSAQPMERESAILLARGGLKVAGRG